MLYQPAQTHKCRYLASRTWSCLQIHVVLDRRLLVPCPHVDDLWITRAFRPIPCTLTSMLVQGRVDRNISCRASSLCAGEMAGMAPTAGRRALGVRQSPGLAGGGALEGAMPRGFVASAPMRRIGVRLGGGLMGSCVRSGVPGGRELLGARVGLNSPCVAAGLNACLVGLTGSCCILRCRTQTKHSMSLHRSMLHKILPCRWTRVVFKVHAAKKATLKFHHKPPDPTASGGKT